MPTPVTGTEHTDEIAMTSEWAIAVEGGAMRGIFSAGVLDVLQEEGFRPFKWALGTSAGACNLASFVSGQHERNVRCYTEIMCRKEFFSATRFMRGGHFMDLDWLWERFAAEQPLDEDAVMASPMQLIAAATCADTGETVYNACVKPAIDPPLKGSCALPVFYRGVVRHGGRELVDGGLTDPFPVAHAYKLGARNIVVVRSRPVDVVKGGSAMDRIGGWMLRHKPALARVTREVPMQYARAVEFALRPPADCKVWNIAPAQPMVTGRTTQDRARLMHDYQQGRVVTLAILRSMQKALAQTRG
jgi:predicted patatin/cPLA2 family phospholipase